MNPQGEGNPQESEHDRGGKRMMEGATELCSPRTVASAATPIDAATCRLVLKSADARPVSSDRIEANAAASIRRPPISLRH